MAFCRGPDLQAVGVLPTGWGGAVARATSATALVPCMTGGMLGTLLRTPGSQAVFLTGMLSGFMPCGLVYAYLALATSREGPLPGSVTMIVFGLGTVPLMVLTGSGLSLVSPARRHFVLRLAGWCVVATGLISSARGVYALQLDSAQPEAACPFCE